MRTKTNELYNVFLLVIPNQKTIIIYMAFHIVFPFSFQWVRTEFFGYGFSILEFVNYPLQRFNLFHIFAKTLEVFLKLRSFSDFFHDYSIEAMKLSKLSVETTPASFPLSASFIAAKVTALGTSSHTTSFAEVLLALNTLTP